jgi:hypothetical protein
MSKLVVLPMNILTGRKVESAAGEDLGKIDDLILDNQTGRVIYAIVSFGGFPRSRQPLGRRSLEQISPEGQSENVHSGRRSRDSAADASFDKEHWPQMNLPKWRERIEIHFAYQPREQRQIHEGAEYIDDVPRSASRQEKERGNAA